MTRPLHELTDGDIIRSLEDRIAALERATPNWIDLTSAFTTTEWVPVAGTAPAVAVINGRAHLSGYIHYAPAGAAGTKLLAANGLPIQARPKTARWVPAMSDVISTASTYYGGMMTLVVNVDGSIVLGGNLYLKHDGTTTANFPSGVYLPLEGLSWAL